MCASVQAGLELAVAVGLAAIGLLALVISVMMGNPLNQPIGPGYVPACLAILIMVLSAWNAIGCFRQLCRQLGAPPEHDPAWPTGKSCIKVGLPFAVVLTLAMRLLFQNVLKVDLG